MRVIRSRWRRRCSARTTLAAANRALVWSQPLNAWQSRSEPALRDRSVNTACVTSSASCVSLPTRRRAVE